MIQANFLYHPLESAKFVADGEQASLSKIYGLNHRTLLQQLIQSDELAGDWMRPLETIEETINAKGQAILFTDNEGQWYAPGEQSGYYMG